MQNWGGRWVVVVILTGIILVRVKSSDMAHQEEADPGG